MDPKRRLIKQKDHVLLLNSNIIHDYQDLRLLLSENDIITYEIANEQSKVLKELINNMLDRIITQAVKEWKGEEKDFEIIEKKADWKRCSLCNQPNKYIFYITNNINNINLNVGSECIKHFGIKIGDDALSIGDLIKNAEKLMRLAKLNNEIPGIAQIIDKWKDDIERYPILIPINYELPYKGIYERAKECYTRYLDGKESEDVATTTIKDLLIEKEIIVQEIESFVDKQSKNRFIPSRNMVNWLKRKRKFDVIDMLKKDGVISWGTLHRVEEPNFMNSLIPDYNKKLSEIETKIVEIDEDRLSYVLTVKSERIKILNKFSDFNLSFGWIIFYEQPIERFELSTLLIKSRIYDENTFINLADILKHKFKDQEINISDFNYDFNEMLIYNREKQKYMIIELQETIEKFKNIAILNDKLDNIANYLSNFNYKDYTLEELKNLQIPSWKYG